MNTGIKDREELKKQVGAIIDKAERSLKAAGRLIDDEDLDFGASRLYYALFYAMTGALLTKNISASKHTGVISNFSKSFIKPGIFPKEFSKIISRLSRERQVGDYGFYFDVSEDDLLKDMASAKDVLDKIKTYLRKEDFL
ncbi:MAG: HEPN domain-containing protein [bacterium]|nr:HEPN domain-containing protein [bacterium]